MDKKETYYSRKAPKRGSIENWGLDKVDDMPEYANGNSIPVQIDEDGVIQRLSRDIYSNSTSGVREILANEIKACKDTLEMDPNANPEIVVTINTLYRQITIEGIDSKGMSWWTFKHVYCMLGRTTNNDGTVPGQFGFGRAAYLAMSDDMSLQTHSRETGEKYTIIGREGIEFITGDAPPKMEHFGTRIDITPRNDVDLEDLIDMVKSCARLSGIKTTIIADGEFERHSGVVEQHSITTLCTRNADRRVRPIVLENENVEIGFVLDDQHSSGGSYLVGVPIEYQYDGTHNNISELTVNIKDERKFEPTPDRERLSEKAAKLVSKEIDSLISAELKRLGEITSLEEYISDYNKHLFEHYIEGDRGNLDKHLKIGFIRDLMDIEVSKTNTGIKFGGKRQLPWCRRNFRASIESPTSAQFVAPRLGNIVTTSNFLTTIKWYERHIDAIRRYDPTIEIVRIDKEDQLLCSKHGIQTIYEYMKANNINVKSDPRKERAENMVRIYEAGDQRNPKDRCSEYGIPDDVVIVNKEQENEIHRLKETIADEDPHSVKFQYVRERAIGKDYSGGMTFSEWMDIVNNTKVDTDQGRMSLKEIEETGKLVTTYGGEKSVEELSLKDGIICISTSKYIDRMLTFYLNFQGKAKHNLSVEFVRSMRLQFGDLDQSELGACVIAKDETTETLNDVIFTLLERFNQLQLKTSIDLMNNLYEPRKDYPGNVEMVARRIVTLEQELLRKHTIPTIPTIQTTSDSKKVCKVDHINPTRCSLSSPKSLVRVYELVEECKTVQTIHPANNIPNDVVIVDDQQGKRLEKLFQDNSHHIEKCMHSFRYVEKSTLGDDYSGGMTFSEWMKVVKNTICETSEGIMTLKQVIETGKDRLLSYRYESVWNLVLKDDVICIIMPTPINTMLWFCVNFDDDGALAKNDSATYTAELEKRHIDSDKIDESLKPIFRAKWDLDTDVGHLIDMSKKSQLKDVSDCLVSVYRRLNSIGYNTSAMCNLFTAMEQDMIKTYNIDTKTSGA